METNNTASNTASNTDTPYAGWEREFLEDFEIIYDTDIGENHTRHGVRSGEVAFVVAIVYDNVVYEDAAEFNEKFGEWYSTWEDIEDEIQPAHKDY